MNSPAVKSSELFYKAILNLETEEECRDFFEDILTMKELQDISQRLEVAMLLNSGSNYQKVSAKTGVSSATISRVNRCLQYGSGGYKAAIAKLESQEDRK